MVDFYKLANKKLEKKIYTYKCRKCKYEIEYVVRLPQHMLNHGGERVIKDDKMFRCYGILDFIKEALYGQTEDK